MYIEAAGIAISSGDNSLSEAQLMEAAVSYFKAGQKAVDKSDFELANDLYGKGFELSKKAGSAYLDTVIGDANNQISKKSYYSAAEIYTGGAQRAKKIGRKDISVVFFKRAQELWEKCAKEETDGKIRKMCAKDAEYCKKQIKELLSGSTTV